MGFVNRMLEEDERREYVLDYPSKGIRGKFIGGTIDDENDVRLFNYANGHKGKMEPCDIYSFVFDYKGKVFFVHLRQRIPCGNDVHWSFASNSDKNKFTESEIMFLREAMKVYAYHGFMINEWNQLKLNPLAITENDECNIFIEF